MHDSPICMMHIGDWGKEISAHCNFKRGPQSCALALELTKKWSYIDQKYFMQLLSHLFFRSYSCGHSLTCKSEVKPTSSQQHSVCFPRHVARVVNTESTSPHHGNSWARASQDTTSNLFDECDNVLYSSLLIWIHNHRHRLLFGSSAYQIPMPTHGSENQPFDLLNPQQVHIPTGERPVVAGCPPQCQRQSVEPGGGQRPQHHTRCVSLRLPLPGQRSEVPMSRSEISSRINIKQKVLCKCCVVSYSALATLLVLAWCTQWRKDNHNHHTIKIILFFSCLFVLFFLLCLIWEHLYGAPDATSEKKNIKRLHKWLICSHEILVCSHEILICFLIV